MEKNPKDKGLKLCLISLSLCILGMSLVVWVFLHDSNDPPRPQRPSLNQALKLNFDSKMKQSSLCEQLTFPKEADTRSLSPHATFFAWWNKSPGKGQWSEATFSQTRHAKNHIFQFNNLSKITFIFELMIHQRWYPFKIPRLSTLHLK